MTKTDEHWMQTALAAARQGMDLGQSPFGAAIVKNNQLVIAAHNVVWQTLDITAHGEVTAIRLACQKLQTIDLRGCTIYSTTEPCPMCFAAIHWARIDKIVYGAAIADAQSAGFHELTLSNQQMKQLGASPVQIVPGVLQKEAAQMFQEFLHRGGKTY